MCAHRLPLKKEPIALVGRKTFVKTKKVRFYWGLWMLQRVVGNHVTWHSQVVLHPWNHNILVATKGYCNASSKAFESDLLSSFSNTFFYIWFVLLGHTSSFLAKNCSHLIVLLVWISLSSLKNFSHEILNVLNLNNTFWMSLHSSLRTTFF